MSTCLPTVGLAVCAILVLQDEKKDAVQKTGFTSDSSAKATEIPPRPRRAASKLMESPADSWPSDAAPLTLPAPRRNPTGSNLFVRPLVVHQCQIKMPDEIRVPVEIAGVLIDAAVQEGAVVKRGDVLARLDDRIAKLDEEHKKRQAENQSTKEMAKRKLDHFDVQLRRAQTLHKSGGASPLDVELARAQVDLAIEECKDAEIKLLLADIDYEKAEEALRRHTIRSPVDGVVSQRLKHEGEAVQAMEPVFHIVRTDRIKVQGQMESRYVDRLKVGMVVEVWPDVAVGERTTFNHTAPVRCVRVLADGERVAFGGEDGKVVVANVATGEVEREIKASDKPIRGLAISPSEPNLLACVGDDGAVRLWNLGDGLESRPALRAPERGDTPVLAICLDPSNSKRGWIGDADGRILEWDFAKGVVVRSFSGPSGGKAHINPIACLTLAPDGRSLLSVGDNAARWWRLSDATILNAFDHRSGPTQKEVRHLNFSPDGQEIPCNSDALIQFKKTANGVAQDSLESPQQSFASFIFMAPTDGLVLTAREDGELQLWRRAKDHRPARLARVYRGHRTDAQVHQVDFAANGRFFATCSSDRTVKVWAMPTIQELDAERLAAKVVFVDPQAGPTGASAFHAEVDNRGGMLKGNTTASVVVYP